MEADTSEINYPAWMEPSKAADIIVETGRRAGLSLKVLLGNELSRPMDILSSEGWGICWFMTTGTVAVASKFDEETGMIMRWWPSRYLMRYSERLADPQNREQKCIVKRAEAMVPFILDHLTQIRRLHERSRKK